MLRWPGFGASGSTGQEAGEESSDIKIRTHVDLGFDIPGESLSDNGSNEPAAPEV